MDNNNNINNSINNNINNNNNNNADDAHRPPRHVVHHQSVLVDLR